MTRATRASLAGRIYLDLQNKARKEGRPTSELLQLYALEGFLERLAASKHRSALVLKGGALLSAYEVRRGTRDLDFQARRLKNDADAVLRTVQAVAAVDLQDGLAFDENAAAAELIREGDEYQGIRVSLPCTLASARVGFSVDVSVGDPIWPGPEPVSVAKLLGGTIELSGYPLTMIHAEKIVTAFQRGTANTRWRDFADVYLLSGRHPISGDVLGRAIAEVARFRKAEIVSLAAVLEGYAALGQSRWAKWRRAQRMEEQIPAEFGDVLDAMAAFADPVLLNRVAGLKWNPRSRTWQ
jgi:hypothetical protein